MLYSALQHISLYITAKTDLVRKASSTCTHLTANIPFPYNVLIFEEEHRLDGQGQELGETYLSVLEQGHLRHIPNTLLPHYSQSLWRCILCTSYTHACLCAAPQCNGEDTQPRRYVYDSCCSIHSKSFICVPRCRLQAHLVNYLLVETKGYICLKGHGHPLKE